MFRSFAVPVDIRAITNAYSIDSYLLFTKCTPDVLKNRSDIRVDDDTSMSCEFCQYEHTGMSPCFLSVAYDCPKNDQVLSW